MNKKKILFISLLLSSSLFFASEILVAPLAVYDSAGDRITSLNNPSKEIFTELEKHWFEGLLKFSFLSEAKYGEPLSVLDANKICSVEGKDYILYGFIKKYDSSFYADVKLYCLEEKKVVNEFFSSDDINHFERMMKILCGNILDGIEDLTGFNQDELIKENYHDLELRIPSSLYYWSPIDGKWNKRILGLVGVNTGVELFPPLPNLVIYGMKLDFSARFNLSWSIAANQMDTFPLVLNNISVSFPLIAYLHFNDTHCVYHGAGFGYELELMSIRPKYENTRFSYQNVFYAELVVGYELKLNETVNLFSEIEFDIQFAKGGFVSIKPAIGASFNIYRGCK